MGWAIIVRLGRFADEDSFCAPGMIGISEDGAGFWINFGRYSPDNFPVLEGLPTGSIKTGVFHVKTGRYLAMPDNQLRLYVRS